MSDGNGNLPDPPVPPEVDGRELGWMPLHLHRLRASRTWHRCRQRPELAYYLFNLWSAAWLSCPAGSIEADDEALADAAECPADKWPDLKPDLLRGWVVCSDGRAYCPTVAELALEAWEHLMATRSGWKIRQQRRRQRETKIREIQ